MDHGLLVSVKPWIDASLWTLCKFYEDGIYCTVDNNSIIHNFPHEKTLTGSNMQRKI